MLAENIIRSAFGFRSLKRIMAMEEGRPKGYFFTLKLTCFWQILVLIWHLMALNCNGFDPWPHSQPKSRLPQFHSLLPPHSPREPLAGQAEICGFKVLVHFCWHGGLVALPSSCRADGMCGVSGQCWEQGRWNPSNSGLSLRARRLFLNNPLGCSPIRLGF